MFELKRLSPSAVPQALAKAERYRLLNESWEAESICLDVLAVDPSNEEATVSLQRSIYDPGYVNAMSHFYRGEMGRIMVWRQRLDITTNWAITSSTAIITIAFTTREVPHIIFFFNLAIVWAMLWIEARPYRFYDAFRARVRMLEAHFLVPMVMVLAVCALACVVPTRRALKVQPIQALSAGG